MSILDLDRSRVGWGVFGLGLVAAVCFVLYSFIGTFVFGVFIYYATRPLYRRIRRRVGPSSVAAAVAIFALALPALVLVSYALLVAFRELTRLTSNDALDVSTYLDVNQTVLNQVADPGLLVDDPTQFVSFDTVESLVQSVNSAAGTLTFLGIGAVHLFVMIALAFYLLRDDHKLARWVLARFADDRGILEEYLRAVDSDFNSIFFGNILNAILTGTIGVIAYSILNVFGPSGYRIPAAALVGLLAGVASLIPVVGMKLVYVPVASVMGVRSIAGAPETLWFVVAFVLVSFVVVDTIPDLVLRPYVSGRSLHVGSIMIAYTFGPLLFGWYGIFLMPMLLVLVVHFARLVLPELVAGEPIQPYMVDPGYLVGAEEAAEATGEVEAVSDQEVVPSEAVSEGHRSPAGEPKDD
ncbi:MAG: AI-2E family transporter [Halobacteriota archaeon]